MAKGVRSNRKKRAGAIRKELCKPFENQQIEKLSKKLDAIRGVANEETMDENPEPENVPMNDEPQPKARVVITQANDDDDEMDEKLKVTRKIMKKRNRPSQKNRKQIKN